MDFDAVQAHITTLAREVGRLLLAQANQPHTEGTKSSTYDLVTEADRAADVHIINNLLIAYPEHHIISEEGGGRGAPEDTADYFWYIDPLDGTTNFAHGIPHYSTSIALANRQLQPLVAVVYHPVNDELYAAVRGQGATLNGKPLQVSTATELGKSVIGSGFPYDKWTSEEDNTREWGAVVKRVRGVRRIGSAALDLCYVAAGRFDGYWEQKVNLWDCMAGILLVQEAGGCVSDYTGDTRTERYAQGRIVASNGHIHSELLSVLQAARGQ